MGKPFAFTCSLSCLALKAFSLFDCKFLMIKTHLTSIDLNCQFLIYTTSQLIVVDFLLSFTGSSSFKGLILYLKIIRMIFKRTEDLPFPSVSVSLLKCHMVLA